MPRIYEASTSTSRRCSPDGYSYAWFRALFARQLFDVNCLSTDEVAAAVACLDAGGIVLPSSLPFSSPHARAPCCAGMPRLLDATIQVAVALALRSAPDAACVEEIWPQVEKNLTALGAPTAVLRYARRDLLARGIGAFTARE